MAKKISKSLSAAVSAEIKSKFDLNKFKSSKGLDKNVKFKEQQWIPLSPAFQEITGVPGIPMGHISLLRGHSDTGKTTALLEAAVSAQKIGILPVFIITEMKWNWEHAAQMGLEVKLIKDEEGEKRDGAYGMIWYDTKWNFQPVFKYEFFDPSHEVKEIGYTERMTIGLNYFFNDYIRVQLNYQANIETYINQDNDRFLAQIQVKF